MASGSARAAPAHGSGWSPRRKLVRGQLYCATISVQILLHQIAKLLAGFADVPFTTPTPATTGRNRPCIFLRQTELGIHVMPLSTFEGSGPDEWNLLLRAIALPLGGDIPSIFHDRPGFQTQPPWNHQDGNQTYIVPGTVILPIDAWLGSLRVPTFMDRAMVKQLEDHSLSVMQNFENGSRDELIRLLVSYDKQPTAKTVATTSCSEENTQVANGPIKSTLNPEAPKFIPRTPYVDALSFPDLAGSRYASTIGFTTASPSVNTPSILQALQNNVPFSARTPEIDMEPRKPPGAHKEDKDKENMRL